MKQNPWLQRCEGSLWEGRVWSDWNYNHFVIHLAELESRRRRPVGHTKQRKVRGGNGVPRHPLRIRFVEGSGTWNRWPSSIEIRHKLGQQRMKKKSEEKMSPVMDLKWTCGCPAFSGIIEDVGQASYTYEIYVTFVQTNKLWWRNWTCHLLETCSGHKLALFLPWNVRSFTLKICSLA